jgi:hypothetical protein
VSHGCSCHTYIIEFCNCIEFDSISIVIMQGHSSLSFYPSEFKDAKYHHCALLCRLSKCNCDSVTSLIAEKSDSLPAWISYNEKTIVNQLLDLLVSVFFFFQNLPGSFQALNLSGIQRKIII